MSHMSTRPGGRIHPALPPALGLALGLLLAGCATPTPPPHADLALAQAALGSAAGAGGETAAPTEMGLARSKLERAHQALREERHPHALQLAREARSDAQLAEAMAESAKARKAAAEVQEASRVLREEIQQRPPTPSKP